MKSHLALLLLGILLLSIGLAVVIYAAWNMGHQAARDHLTPLVNTTARYRLTEVSAPAAARDTRIVSEVEIMEAFVELRRRTQPAARFTLTRESPGRTPRAG